MKMDRNRAERVVHKKGDEWFLFLVGKPIALAKFDFKSKGEIFRSEASKLSDSGWIELKASDISSGVFQDFATTCLRKFCEKEVTIDSFSIIGDYKFRLYEWIQGELH